MLWLWALIISVIHVGMVGWLAAAWRKRNPEILSPETPPLSVLICARNEAENLPRLLACLTTQAYPEYEVIIINDRSEDESADLLAQAVLNDSRLRVITLTETPHGWSPKKWAIHHAVLASKYEYLILTDADCTMGQHWLWHMSRPFLVGKSLILGIGLYEKENSFLNDLIQYETRQTAFLYTSRALQGKAYMGIGRNIAYSKSLYHQAGGMEALKDSLSGDDDLLVKNMTAFAQTAVVTHRDAITWSRPKKTWRDWYRQKLRHLSAGKRYHPNSLLFLGIYHHSHLLFYLIGLITFCDAEKSTLLWTNFFIFAGLLGAKNFVIHLVTRRWEKSPFSPKDLLHDFCYVIYIAFLVPLSVLHRPVWKPTKSNPANAPQKTTD
jgi:cellulose synthase/poly-beta-1,6-N-acetylglucosamine synthase-like glycosyltransferase